ncbi:MAG: cytochrome b/b6 domain-containing protein [Coriobacteriales bacterium]|nr:cytochrome b/b6 domain-containing protein [Coriobacteriales bacterium]
MVDKLVSFNVWLDNIFALVWAAALAFVVFHFSVGIVKGRFRKKFIEHQWPEHDHRPPLTPKLLHGVHMAGIIILAITGMYIRFPHLMGARTFMRNTHYFFMIVVTITLVWRVWYAFWSKNKDWPEFAVGKKDLQSLVGVLAYYGYFSNKKPHVAKYNVAQKMSYMLFLVMMLAQVFTGFALLRYNIIFGASPRDILIGWWLGPIVGGAPMALWYARMIHYVLNWMFIIMMTIHFYLAASEDIPCTLDFFGIKEMPVVPGHDHEDIPAEEPAPELQPAPEPVV